MEEGSGRGSGWVGSDFLSAIAGRVGSTFRRVGSKFRRSDRVRSKKSDPWTTLACIANIFVRPSLRRRDDSRSCRLAARYRNLLSPHLRLRVERRQSGNPWSLSYQLVIGRLVRHHQINDFVCHSLERAGIPSSKKTWTFSK